MQFCVYLISGNIWNLKQSTAQWPRSYSNNHIKYLTFEAESNAQTFNNVAHTLRANKHHKLMRELQFVFFFYSLQCILNKIYDYCVYSVVWIVQQCVCVCMLHYTKHWWTKCLKAKSRWKMYDVEVNVNSAGVSQKATLKYLKHSFCLYS